MARSALRFRKQDDGWVVAGVTDALEGDEVVIPSERAGMPVVGIGEGAFSKARKLRRVAVPSSVRFMEKDAFSGCDCLERVETPGIEAWLGIDFANRYANPLGHNTLFGVSAALYVGGERIYDLEIPEGTPEIKKFAFFGCNGLKNVHIPGSVRKIGADAFNKISNFDCVHIDDVAAWMKIDFENMDSNPLHRARMACVGGKPLYDLVIPDGVTEVSAYAFVFYSELTSLIIPASVKTFGKMSFYGCEKLVEIRNLSSVDLKTNWEETFGGFYECARRVLSGDEESGIFVTEDGYAVYMKGEDRLFLGYRGDATELTLPSFDGAPMKIVTRAFTDLENITSVVIPDGVTFIASEAFFGCRSLERVSLPDSLEDIDEAAFAACESLKSIRIPDSVKRLGCRVFNWCYSLENVILSENLDEIYDAMFADCRSLKFINIPDRVFTICADTFYGCDSLECVVIPKYLDTIESDAFCGCDKLRAIFYKGGKRALYQLRIDARGNGPFFDAPVYYYSEKPPKKEGNFWHRDRNGGVEIW